MKTITLLMLAGFTVSAHAQENVCSSFFDSHLEKEVYSSVKKVIQVPDGTTLMNSDWENLKKIPFRVMVHYRETEFNQENILSDLGQAHKAYQGGLETVWGMTKNTNKLRKLKEESDSGKECAKYLFGQGELDQPNLVEVVFTPSDKEKDQLMLAFSKAEKEGQSILLTEKGQKILDQYNNGHIYLEGHTRPIDLKKLMNSIHQVMSDAIEESNGKIVAQYGKVHKWSPLFRKHFAKKFPTTLMLPKLLVSLGNGHSSLFSLTGQEQALKVWILERYNLLPHEVIKQSFILNEGDLYKTLLTIENLFSMYWQHPNRKQIDFINRLAPIIHSYGNGADHFGSWYHFFGLMLYSYTSNEASAQAMSTFEVAVSSLSNLLVGTRIDEKQETIINQLGAKVGAGIKRAFKSGTYSEKASYRLEEMDYVTTEENEKYVKRLKKIYKRTL